MDFKTYVPRHPDFVIAIQWDGENKDEVIEFVDKWGKAAAKDASVTFSGDDLIVHYGNGDAMYHMWVTPGWYVIAHTGMLDTMGPIMFNDFYKPEN